MVHTIPHLFRAAAAVAGLSLLTMAPAALADERELVIDVTGISTYGVYSDSRNVDRTFVLAPYALITGLEYELEIEAFAPAQLYQAAVVFGLSPDVDDRVFFLNPGFGDLGTGIGRYSGRYGDLPSEGIQMTLGADGVFNANFFSQWDYDALPVEHTFRSGAITITYEVAAVPEPQTWALLLAGLLTTAGVARLRRSAGR